MLSSEPSWLLASSQDLVDFLVLNCVPVTGIHRGIWRARGSRTRRAGGSWSSGHAWLGSRKQCKSTCATGHKAQEGDQGAQLNAQKLQKCLQTSHLPITYPATSYHISSCSSLTTTNTATQNVFSSTC